MIPLAFGLWLVLLQPATEVLVEGNLSVAKETILHYVGSPSNEDEIQESFRKLWDSGLFEDVRFERRDTALVVIVDEKPLLARARFEGETISEEDVLSRLREAGIGLHQGHPFGVDDAHEAERVTGLVLGPGFRVTARLEPVSETRVDLVLVVEEVSKPRVARIVFEGREALPEQELRNAMKLAPSSFASLFSRRDRFDALLLEQDLDRLRSLYRNRGFAGAQVGPASTQTDSDGRTTIVIPILEGARYRLGEIEIDAGPLLSRDDVADWLPESEPMPSFDASRIEALVERLERYYRARGYPAIEIEQRETARASGDTIDVRLVVRQGGFYLVGRIEFRGNERHRDRDLRQYVDLVEGDRFDQGRLESGERNLMSLGNFRHVAAEVDFASRPGLADITYHLDEIPRFEYLLGGGLNGIQGATGNGQIIARSFVGRGETLRLDLDFGNRFQNVAAGYRDPSTLGHRLFLAVDFSRYDLAFGDDTSEDTLDLAVRVGGPVGRKLQFLAGARLAAFTLGTDVEDDVPFLSEFLGQRFRSARANVTLAYEGRDRTIFPTRGAGLKLSYELVTGDVSAHRRARLESFIPLDTRRRHLIGLAGRAEAVGSFGGTSSDGLPRFERLFLGGENDLRGFAVRSVGPHGGGVAIGGDRLLLGSAEYHFAVLDRWRFVGFFDLGNVYATDFDGGELPALRYDTGLETQILVPGLNLPLRIGYGFNLNRQEDEDRGRFFVSLSFRF